MVRKLKISEIDLDGGTQTRAFIREDVVEEYAESLLSGANLPSICVYSDGEQYWPADGFHRIHAHLKAGKDTIMAEVRQGTRKDALFVAAGCNAEHGLRRSNEDKRQAVGMILEDDEWANRSDNWIAEACNVSAPLVADIRRSRCEPTINIYSDTHEPTINIYSDTREGKDGRTQNTSNIGKQDSDDSTPETDGFTGHSRNEPPTEREPGEDNRGLSGRPKPPKDDTPCDGWGIPITPEAAEAFEADPLYDELILHLKQARKLYKALADHPGGAFLHRHGKSMNTPAGWKHNGIETAIRTLQDCRPTYTVCPYAYGPHDHNNNCNTCAGLGWTPDLRLDMIPEEFIAKAKEQFGV